MKMQWITTENDQSDKPWQRPAGPLSLTIGNFDGVHLGHQALIAESVAWARKHQGQAWLLTFDPHPLQVLAPEKWLARLFDFKDQLNTLQSLGMDGVFVQSFSRAFSELSVEQFLHDFLWKKFQPDQVVVGYDFAFGKKRSGTAAMLRDFMLGKKREFVQVDALKVDGEIVSSTLIRQCLQAGQVEKVKTLLGRPFSYRGVVVKGDQRGRGLGFPTANLSAPQMFAPALGVYATRIRIVDSKDTNNNMFYDAVTNIGVNPTFGGGLGSPLRVESHIFDFSRDIYGETIEVELHHYLRSEKKFSGVNELVAQIHQDSTAARQFLNTPSSKQK